MHNTIRTVIALLAMAVTTAAMSFYCWQNVQQMTDKVVVGGGLGVTTVLLVFASIVVMLPQEKPTRVITASVQRRRSRL